MSKKTLLDLPRSKEGIKIYPDEGGEISDGSTFIKFHHIDGLYSFCVTEKGGYIHLHAMTPIEKYEDGYQMKPQENAKEKPEDKD